jgi:hypothetical protein
MAGAFLFLISMSVYSTHEEHYYGKYQSINPKCKISFIFDENDISKLSVNNLGIDAASITSDLLGVHGNSLLFQINFNDIDKNSNIIKLLIVQVNRKIILVSGYYIRYKYIEKSDTYVILEKHALELTWQPPP